MSFSFDGQKKSYLHILMGFSRPTWATIKRDLIVVPGRPGGYPKKMQQEAREIRVPIEIRGVDNLNLQRTKEDLAGWLITEEAKPLIFDDEIDRTYYAMIDGSLDLNELLRNGKGELTFICPDPFKYGIPKTSNFVDGSTVVVNNGTVGALPVVEATAISDITYMDVYTEEGYMRIGKPIDVGVVAVNKTDVVLSDSLSTLTGWTPTGATVEGAVAGSFKSNGFSFSASSYGVGSGWHGPALKKSIPNAPFTDFILEMRLVLDTIPNGRGRVECYMFDDLSRVIGKIAMKRIGGGATGNTVEVRIGDLASGKNIVLYAGNKGIAWNNFDGLIRITRKGNVWDVYVANVEPDGRQHTRFQSKPYVDAARLYMGNLSQVQLHVAQHSTLPVPPMSITNLKIERINVIPDTSPYIIARAGDVVKFDFKRSELMINGEDMKQLKGDFGSTFFQLPKGDNPIFIDPFESLENAKVTIEERYQ